MDWLRLFTSFSGRIGRAGFWVGLAVAFVLSPFAFALLFAKSGILTMLGSIGPFGAVWWGLLLYIVTVLMVKRFRDRQKSPYMAAIFTVPALIVLVGSYSGWHDVASAFIGLLNVGLIAIAFWFLIELGVFPGVLPPQAVKRTAATKPRTRKA